MMRSMINFLSLFAIAGALAFSIRGNSSSIVTNSEKLCDEMQDEASEANRCQKIVKESAFFEVNALIVCEGIVVADCTFCNTRAHDDLNIPRNKKFKKNKTDEYSKRLSTKGFISTPPIV